MPRLGSIWYYSPPTPDLFPIGTSKNFNREYNEGSIKISRHILVIFFISSTLIPSCFLSFVEKRVNWNFSDYNHFCRRSRRLDLHSASQQSLLHKRSVAGTRYNENLQVDRCPECNAVLEQYDEETVSLCIIALATFIHRESGLAAPLLPDMLQCVAR